MRCIKILNAEISGRITGSIPAHLIAGGIKSELSISVTAIQSLQLQASGACLGFGALWLSLPAFSRHGTQGFISLAVKMSVHIINSLETELNLSGKPQTGGGKTQQCVVDGLSLFCSVILKANTNIILIW